MKLNKSQQGWAFLAIFSVIASIAVVAGTLYALSNGGQRNPFTALAEVLGVYDPDPGTDDACEKDPNCVH